MQEQYDKMRDELKTKEVIGSSGNGLVQITLDGEKAMKAIKIHPDCVDKQDVEGLQDLIRAAYEHACVQLKTDESEMSNFLSMPSL